MSRTASRTPLQELVKQRREGLELSIEELAERARVSPSVVRRLESGHRTPPTAVKLAHVFTVLSVDAAEVQELLPDDLYLTNVLDRMEGSGAFVDVAETVRSRRATADQIGAADMVATKGDLVAAINGGGLRLRDDLKQAGWSIWRTE